MPRLEAVKWKGETYVLVPNPSDDGAAAIATVEQYENGRLSTAHLAGNGEIWQYGKSIGTREEFEWDGTIDVEPLPEALFNLLEEFLKQLFREA